MEWVLHRKKEKRIPSGNVAKGVTKIESDFEKASGKIEVCWKAASLAVITGSCDHFKGRDTKGH